MSVQQIQFKLGGLNTVNSVFGSVSTKHKKYFHDSCLPFVHCAEEPGGEHLVRAWLCLASMGIASSNCVRMSPTFPCTDGHQPIQVHAVEY